MLHLGRWTGDCRDVVGVAIGFLSGRTGDICCCGNKLAHIRLVWTSVGKAGRAAILQGV